MGDTGWLRPASNHIGVPSGEPGTTWLRMERIANVQNSAADSWIALNAYSGSDPDETARLAWDWVIPAGVFPSNAVVTGIEINLWQYFYEHTGNIEDVYCNPIELKLGAATVLEENSGNAATRPREIAYPPTYPVRDDPLDVESLTVIGGPGNIFDLSANYLVSQFFADLASSSAAGNYQNIIKYGMRRTGVPVPSPMPPYEVSVYISSIQLKVYWDIRAVDVDMAATPDMSVTVPTSDLDMVRKLAAVVITDVLIEQAQLGGISAMESSPELEVGLPADLTNGLGFIDSTALPIVTVTIPDIDLALLRFSDMKSAPEVIVSATAVPPGTRINMASGPQVSLTVDHKIIGLVGTEAEPIIEVSMDDPGLAADGTVRAEPFVVVTLTANLMGDINLADDCSEAELTTVVSLLAELGHARGLYSNPNIYVTLDGDGLTNGAALEFAPLVSVTIPFANLGSKFAEPAPDHRTVFKCPVDRTIRITRKDKTIL
jgi:hypothetical protein